MRKRSPLPLLSLLLFAVLLSGCTASTPPEAVQPEPKKMTVADIAQRHMEQYAVSLSLDDMAALDNVDFASYKVVFLGEGHGVAKNTELKLAFIKYLNENLSMRYLIEEAGYCSAIIIDRYLRTGDERLIAWMISAAPGTYIYTEEYYEFFLRLYEYNKSLPEDRKIIILGIDVEHQVSFGLEVLSTFAIEGAEMPASVKTVFDTIMHEQPTADRLAAALETVEANEKAFRGYLGDGYTDFYFGLRSIWQAWVFYSEKAHDLATREAFICENFRDLYALHEMDLCFGMFGEAHSGRTGRFAYQKSLAYHLDSEFEPTKGRVVSFVCLYWKCMSINRKSGSSISVVPWPGGSWCFYRAILSCSRRVIKSADCRTLCQMGIGLGLSRRGAPQPPNCVTEVPFPPRNGQCCRQLSSFGVARRT